MKEYDLPKLLEYKIAVKCKTEKQAEEFFKYLQKQGFEWYNSKRDIKLTYWENYKENTCYRIRGIDCIDYCDEEFYSDGGYIIINIEDIEIKKPKEAFIRTLHFKNPCLTQQEYELVEDILSGYISDKDFDKTTWQGNNEYYFISKDIKIPIQIDTLQKLCQNFPSVSLTDKNIYIKNLGGKI